MEVTRKLVEISQDMEKRNKLYESGKEKRIGNHWLEMSSFGNGDICDFGYHNTIICTLNLKEKTFKTNTGGWQTNSTMRSISDYKFYLSELGYKDLTPKYEYIGIRDFNSKFGVKINASSNNVFEDIESQLNNNGYNFYVSCGMYDTILHFDYDTKKTKYYNIKTKYYGYLYIGIQTTK